MPIGKYRICGGESHAGDEPVRTGHGTSDRDDRVAFGVRRRQAGYEVRAAGPGRDQRHSRFARHAPDTAGNECRVLFMPGDCARPHDLPESLSYVVDLQYGRGLSPYLPAKGRVLDKRLTVRRDHFLHFRRPSSFL